ncbi:sortase (surface protein transpeptidase) [Actinomycetospora succinea]|uniref:Sortase (Surface protein transpeptidase) n=1 Tax=Actinomycetospora succinea TaxID=663603 RepID=A0A4R6VP26_9PSEU|nr:class F sortase [Actinomycetospora succinea]TDQ65061.1 sortase (surface protein transpeptidase) [Actinomycetospora succinea]
MTPPTPPRRRVLTVVVGVLVVLGLVLVGVGALGTAAPPEPAAAPAATAPPATAPPAGPATGPRQDPATGSPPVALDIPTIGVTGPVNSVGLQPDGTLEVPAPGPDYDEAAWYRGSPTPGRVGPAVILGHVDSAANGPSVFYRLGALRPGDRVTVTLADRTTRTFSVTAVRSVPKDAFPRLEVYGDTAGPELRLITCGGDFDDAARSYRDNTVVFARLVG